MFLRRLFTGSPDDEKAEVDRRMRRQNERLARVRAVDAHLPK